ncbi:MAG: ABC-2 type transport system permease protein [Saprospiraceae bacterium]|jgi:ABC-2 type transport system permease protein
MRFLEILKFELSYRAKRPETYAFFFVAVLIGLLSVDFIFEGGLGAVKMNSPYAIALSMSISQVLVLLISSMIMGVAVLRDYQYVMESLIFVTPITKMQYLLGRFFGSFIILFLVSIGLIIGLMLNCYAPWRGSDELLDFSLAAYLWPFVGMVIPTLVYSSLIFFVSGMLSKKLIVVYTQGIFFFMFYLVTMVLSQHLENKQLATLLDPFAFQTMKSVVQYWTPTERNSQLIPLGGLVFYNRVLWMAIGLLVGYIGYRKFSFDLISGKKRKRTIEDEDAHSTHSITFALPEITINDNARSDVRKFLQSTKFHFLTILREPIFWVIVACLIVTIFINSINLGTAYEVDSFPKTYLIVEELKELSVFFFIIVLIIYSGELMWESRDARIDAVMDALPVGNLSNMLSKLAGISLMYTLLMIVLVITGVIFQLLSGYYEFNLPVYMSGLFLGLMPDLILITGMSFLLQAVTNHKFLSHLLLVVVVVFIVMLNAVGYDHPLISFGGISLGMYSEMNGYGDSVFPFLWTKFYWFSFAMLLVLVAVVLGVRGKEVRLVSRLSTIRHRWSTPIKRLCITGIMAMMMSGCFIFYNTNVLREYTLPETEEAYRITYEKRLKKYEYNPQPKIVDINLELELFPREQTYIAIGTFVLENKSDIPIAEVHIQKVPSDYIILDTLFFSVDGMMNIEDEEFGYYKYKLETPLAVGDTVIMNFRQSYSSYGFGPSSATDIVYNGTFLNNDHFPTLGYNSKFETRDANIRKSNELAPRKDRANINDVHELKNGKTGGDGYEINFQVVVSTVSSQRAIAPGAIVEEWQEGDRNYYHYKMNEPMINFYNVVSARYEVVHEYWNSNVDTTGSSVQLEIYHHLSHEDNLERMMDGMKASLTYYEEAFGPYPYQNLRIMEFPRYRSFAQSFPGTIPYSESLGFILDIDDDTDVDMAFYVTAHEVAHQWWGLQVIAANVEGRHMISEALAQYSALMVLRKEYGEKKVRQMLAQERERYLKGRTNDDKVETSLARVTSHKYVHYGKGAINMFALQDYIGEEMVNLALRRFVDDWNAFGEDHQEDRYATTDDLLSYFREVTPDTLQYVITDLFETITLYDNQVSEASYKEISPEEYEISMDIQSIKYRVDSLGIEYEISSNDWVDIGVYALNEEGDEQLVYLQKHKINAPIFNVVLRTKRLPTKVAIDPNNILIDRMLDDNLKEAKRNTLM